MAPRILILIALGGNYLFCVKSIATFALTFFGYIISVLANVNSQFQNYESEFSQFFDQSEQVSFVYLLSYLLKIVHTLHIAPWAGNHGFGYGSTERSKTFQVAKRSSDKEAFSIFKTYYKKIWKKYSNVLKVLVKINLTCFWDSTFKLFVTN